MKQSMTDESNAGPYWFHKHPKKVLAVMALLGLLSCLVVAEIVARTCIPVWAPARAERVNFWVYDELLGWAHKPLQHGQFKHPDFSVTVNINSRGLRDTEYPIQRTTGKKRMLVLGDSFGWGFGVEQEARFSEVLENEHPDWEIINASVSGYGTDQQLLYLKEYGIAYEPDIVLLLFCENDFTNNIRSEQNWFNKPFFTMENNALILRNNPVPQSTLRQRLDRFFFGKTYFWSRIYRSSLQIYARLRKSSSPGVKEYLGKANAYEITAALIKSMNELCKEDHAGFILVSIAMDQAKQTVLQNLSAQNSISYLPLDRFFAGIEDKVTFHSDDHWNAVGHQVAAAAIGQFLVELHTW